MFLNTLDKKIIIVVEKNEEGYVVYDDTESFIDVVHIDDKDTVLRIVNSIAKERLYGNKSSSIR
jgi:hypothetical protein